MNVGPKTVSSASCTLPIETQLFFDAQKRGAAVFFRHLPIETALFRDYTDPEVARFLQVRRGREYDVLRCPLDPQQALRHNHCFDCSICSGVGATPSRSRAPAHGASTCISSSRVPAAHHANAANEAFRSLFAASIRNGSNSGHTRHFNHYSSRASNPPDSSRPPGRPRLSSAVFLWRPILAIQFLLVDKL